MDNYAILKEYWEVENSQGRAHCTLMIEKGDEPIAYRYRLSMLITRYNSPEKPFMSEFDVMYLLSEKSEYMAFGEVLEVLPKNIYTKEFQQWCEGLTQGRLDALTINTTVTGNTMAEDDKNAFRWSPRTKPTNQQKQQMREAAQKLVKSFTAKRLAEMMQVSENYLRVLASKGKIPAPLALKIDSNPLCKKMGFSKEYLRPDIKEWLC